jgi:hypothetical protein
MRRRNRTRANAAQGNAVGVAAKPNREGRHAPCDMTVLRGARERVPRDLGVVVVTRCARFGSPRRKLLANLF